MNKRSLAARLGSRPGRQRSIHQLWGTIHEAGAGTTFKGMSPEEAMYFMGVGCAISSAEAAHLLQQLRVTYTTPELAGILSVNTGTLVSAMEYGKAISLPVRKLIWIFWSLNYRPANLRDALSILSWGKIARTEPNNKHKPMSCDELDYAI